MKTFHRATLSPSQQVVATITENAHQPGCPAAGSTETVKRDVSANEGFLRGVLRLIAVSKACKGIGKRDFAITLDKNGIRGVVAAARGLHEQLVRYLHRRWGHCH